MSKRSLLTNSLLSYISYFSATSQCQTLFQLCRSSIWSRPFSFKYGQHGILSSRPSFTRLWSVNTSVPDSPRARHDVSHANGSVWTQHRRHGVRHALPSLSAVCDPSTPRPRSTWNSLPATWNPNAKSQSRTNIPIWLGVLPSFTIPCPLWTWDASSRPNGPDCMSSPH